MIGSDFDLTQPYDKPLACLGRAARALRQSMTFTSILTLELEEA